MAPGCVSPVHSHTVKFIVVLACSWACLWFEFYLALARNYTAFHFVYRTWTIKTTTTTVVERRTLTLKVMLSVLLITQTRSRTRQHNYEFNGVWVNRTDEAWRHLPLDWQWKNLIYTYIDILFACSVFLHFGTLISTQMLSRGGLLPTKHHHKKPLLCARDRANSFHLRSRSKKTLLTPGAHSVPLSCNEPDKFYQNLSSRKICWKFWGEVSVGEVKCRLKVVLSNPPMWTSRVPFF